MLTVNFIFIAILHLNVSEFHIKILNKREQIEVMNKSIIVFILLLVSLTDTKEMYESKSNNYMNLNDLTIQNSNASFESCLIINIFCKLL